MTKSKARRRRKNGNKTGEDDSPESRKRVGKLQKKQDSLAKSELGCFLFSASKDDEKSASQVFRWLVETRWKKNWIIIHSNNFSADLFWNTTESSSTRPENVWKVMSLSGEERDLTGEKTFVRSDLVNAFSRLFSEQSNGKIGRVHNVCVVSENSVDLIPLLRAFFIDSLPSITRILLHGILLIVRAEVKDENENSRDENPMLVTPKSGEYFKKNLALCDAIFIISNKTSSTSEKKRLELEIFNHNDRCFITHVPINAFSITSNSNEYLKPRTDFELYSYSRYVATMLVPTPKYVSYLEERRRKKQEIVEYPGVTYKTYRFRLYTSCEMKKLIYFLDQLLLKNPGIMRLKGCFALQSSGEKYVLQGCSKFWGMEEGQTWNNERRQCRLLIIGSDLPQHEMILKDLKSCKAKMSMFERFYWFYESERCLACLGLLFFISLWSFVVFAMVDFKIINKQSFDNLFSRTSTFY